MAGEWKHQVRVVLEPGAAELARTGLGEKGLGPLTEILKKHGAELKCQFDAFAGYVTEAELHGVDRYPLYEWTKATIEDPVKKNRYLSVFTIYAGGEEVYERRIADALVGAIEPLVGGAIVSKLTCHDTNPANNPQPPKKLTKSK